jgi:[acyl-carrier-protein] S-malonyltransferase
MAPAAAKLAEKLETVPFTSPRIPVLHNVDVSEHPEPEAIRRALAQQAAHPVQWTKTLREMISRGVTDICECGPGKVLAGLNKRGAKEAKGFALNSTAAILDAMTAIKGE